MLGPNAAELTTWRTFLEAHARVTAVLAYELETEARLPLTWYDVLVQLSEAEGRRLRLTELAARVLLSKAGLSRLVDRMAAAGLVGREPCEDDRRGTYVRMSDAGHAALAAAAPVHLRGVEEHFSRHLTRDESTVLARALRRVG